MSPVVAPGPRLEITATPEMGASYAGLISRHGAENPKRHFLPTPLLCALELLPVEIGLLITSN
jgi:hypothetical protein